MLAGLPKAPSAYNPIANPKRATLRQRYIINRMFETGFITEAQHDEALAQPNCATAPRPRPRCMPSTWPRPRASWCLRSTAMTPTRAA